MIKSKKSVPNNRDALNKLTVFNSYILLKSLGPLSRLGADSDLGFASLIVISRSFHLYPVIPAMAFSASASSISTNPNPRDLPVNLSVTTLAEMTLPNSENLVERSASVTAQGRFPTNKLFIRHFSPDFFYLRLMDSEAQTIEGPLRQAAEPLPFRHNISTSTINFDLLTGKV